MVDYKNKIESYGRLIDDAFNLGSSCRKTDFYQGVGGLVGLVLGATAAAYGTDQLTKWANPQNTALARYTFDAVVALIASGPSTMMGGYIGSIVGELKKQSADQ